MPEHLSRKLGVECPVYGWLAEPLNAEIRSALGKLAQAPGVEHMAIMPDVHRAMDVCIGVVLGTTRWVYPQAVGADIGCGISTMALGANASVLADPERAQAALRAMQRAVPIFRWPTPALSPRLADDLIACAPQPLIKGAIDREGRWEFATLGRGNHFLEIQVDDDDRLWLAVHSGSRGVGPIVHSRALAGGVRSAGGLLRLDADESVGQEYLDMAGWCVRYAAASRARMLVNAAEALSSLFPITPDAASLFGSPHNLVASEMHADRSMLVHRKGAGIAATDARGVIPGSISSITYHVRGRGAALSLASSSHGAGRVMSRTEARQKISTRAAGGSLAGVCYDQRLLDHLVEESPMVYRDIQKVMRAQRDLVVIERRLRTLVSHKGR